MSIPATDSRSEIVELAEKISTCGHELGLSVGLKQAAASARQQAGEVFARGDDRRAEILRDLADALDTQARAARLRYDTDFAPVKAAAFARLDHWPPSVSDGEPELCAHGFAEHCPEGCN